MTSVLILAIDTSRSASTGLQILVIAAGSFLLYRVLRRVILRSAGRVPSRLLTSRSQLRARTIASTLTSVLAWVISVTAILAMLGATGVNLAPFIAGASIVGAAIGFGCQTLVRDCLNGFFLVLEDQMGVGDEVDLGEVKGTVEAVGLRVTRLRGTDGVRWYVPNGEIKRVGNRSQPG